MKRLERAPAKFGALELFAQMAREGNLPLDEDVSGTAFGTRLTASIEQARRSPTMLHGRRTQELFAYVAASLGETKLIKSEDCGDVIAEDTGIQVPDYRVVLKDGRQLLVEVKNCRSRAPRKPVRLSSSYLSGLSAYGALTGAPVFIAVYWPGWNLWTLTPLNEIPPEGLTLLSGTLRNHVCLLGDEALATTPPLTFRVVADPAAPRTREPSGLVPMTIGRLEYYCGGNPILEKAEQHLAFLLMVLGSWQERDSEVKMDGESIVHIDYVHEPEERVSDQPFEIIGHHSSFISRRFDLLTTKERAITSLCPADPPGSLGLGIPERYASKALPLWRFRMKPGSAGAC